MPDSNYHRMIDKLNKVYDWDKVAQIKIAKTENDNFIKTLHQVESKEL